MPIIRVEMFKGCTKNQIELTEVFNSTFGGENLSKDRCNVV